MADPVAILIEYDTHVIEHVIKYAMFINIFYFLQQPFILQSEFFLLFTQRIKLIKI